MIVEVDLTDPVIKVQVFEGVRKGYMEFVSGEDLFGPCVYERTILDYVETFLICTEGASNSGPTDRTQLGNSGNRGTITYWKGWLGD